MVVGYGSRGHTSSHLSLQQKRNGEVVYKRVQSLDDLKSALLSTETCELDFKAFVDSKEWWELAKDIAAFANYLGGVILVGATEESTGLPRLCGIELDFALTLKEAYEKAARDKCSPRPLLTAVILEPPEIPDRRVLAVNVEPVPDQIVGAMFCGRNSQGQATTSDAWRFPIRIGKDNIAITPDRIPMFIDAKTRRVAIRLSSIPRGSTPQLVWRRPSNQSNESPVVEPIIGLEVDVPANVFRARRVNDARQPAFSVPLDDVEAVWEATQANWRVRITGWLDDKNGYVTNPSNTIIKR